MKVYHRLNPQASNWMETVFFSDIILTSIQNIRNFRQVRLNKILSPWYTLETKIQERKKKEFSLPGCSKQSLYSQAKAKSQCTTMKCSTHTPLKYIHTHKHPWVPVPVPDLRSPTTTACNPYNVSFRRMHDSWFSSRFGCLSALFRCVRTISIHRCAIQLV